MNQNNPLVLKKGKEKAIINRHHWIFSGAVAKYPKVEDGAFVSVHSSEGQSLGWAYVNKKTSIVARMLSFDETPPLEVLRSALQAAIAMRKNIIDTRMTTAYRLVNGEGDAIPGLIVDRYADVLVIQLVTVGMDRLRQQIVDMLVELVKPAAIFEKSSSPARHEEGLEKQIQLLHGKMPKELNVIENGLKFVVQPEEGQKTGFFLDHREMRQWVRGMSHGKRVLNCFGYTGGFSIYAHAGGATKVDTVDISAPAIALAKVNMENNGASITQHGFFAEDVFEFLRKSPMDYQLVILDPPAFAKKKKDQVQACRAYKDINRVAMEKMPSGSILVTSSCSYHVDETLFQQVVFQAAAEAGRRVQIIGRHRQASDHPINLFHPESDYLKSLILYVV